MIEIPEFFHWPSQDLGWADATEISYGEDQRNWDLALWPFSPSYRTLSSYYNSQSGGQWAFN